MQVEEEQASGRNMGASSWLASGLSIEESQYVDNW